MVYSALCLALLGALALLYEKRRSPLGVVAAADCSPAAWWLGVVLAWLIRIVGLFVLARQGHFQFDPDEQFRYQIALRFMEHPTLDGGFSGVWMPGNQLYFGLWMKLWPDPFAGFLLGVVLAHGLNLLAAAWLATTVVGRRWAGAWAALLLAPAYLYQWYGLGALVEINLASMTLLLAGCLWHCSRSQPGGPPWREILKLGAALFGCTFLHIQGWYVVCLAGLGWFGVAMARGWLRERRGWLQLGTLAVASVSFPLLWAVYSGLQWGHPAAFLVHVRQNLATERVKWNLPWNGQTALIYPRMVGQQLAWLLPLLGGGLLAARPLCRRGATLILFGLALLALAVGMGLASRFIVPVNHRFMIPPATLAIVGVAILLANLERLVATRPPGGGRRTLAWLGLGLLLLPWYGANHRQALRFAEQSYWTNFRADVYPLAEWLRRELLAPRLTPPLPAQPKVGIRTQWGAGETALFLIYYTGRLSQVWALPDDKWNADSMASEGYDLVISDDPRQPAHYEPVARMQGWVVYRRQSAAATAP